MARLNTPQRFLFLGLNLGLGALPSLAFFAWVERNASLPWIGGQLGWPWFTAQQWPVPAQVLWDTGLFLTFGFLHSLAAQSGVQRFLSRWVPVQGLRTLYLALTGTSLLALMGLWQNTGVVLWVLPWGVWAVNALSLALFWGLMAFSARVMSGFDALEFIGLKQLYWDSSRLQRSEGIPKLETTGVYAWVRHPIYTFTGLAFTLTPFMTLDRALLIAAMTLYLTAAIPLEERKLIALFGEAYESYRQKVPAVLPRFPGVRA